MTEAYVARSEALLQWAARVLQARGMSAAAAGTVAESLVEANLRGVDTHGVMRLPIYAKRLRLGVIDPRAEPEVCRESASTALVDAHNAMGQVSGRFAIDLAIRKAQDHDVGIVGVRNSNHFGMAAYYALRAAQEGMIGFAASNTTPLMPPTGGKEARVGNNPIAIAVPGPDGNDPLVLDMALSVVAVGKFMLAKKRGEPIPAGWAVDREGRPTTDPSAALEGFPLPVGGHKGYGLALIIDILVGVMTGSGFGARVLPMYKEFDRPQRMGQFYMALNPEAFGEREAFYRHLGELYEEVRDTPTAEGVDSIKLPGEIEQVTRRRRLAEGIPLPAAVYDELLGLAEEDGLPAPPVTPLESTR